MNLLTTGNNLTVYGNATASQVGGSVIVAPGAGQSMDVAVNGQTIQLPKDVAFVTEAGTGFHKVTLGEGSSVADGKAVEAALGKGTGEENQPEIPKEVPERIHGGNILSLLRLSYGDSWGAKDVSGGVPWTGDGEWKAAGGLQNFLKDNSDAVITRIMNWLKATYPTAMADADFEAKLKQQLAGTIQGCVNNGDSMEQAMYDYGLIDETGGTHLRNIIEERQRQKALQLAMSEAERWHSIGDSILEQQSSQGLVRMPENSNTGSVQWFSEGGLIGESGSGRNTLTLALGGSTIQFSQLVTAMQESTQYTPDSQAAELVFTTARGGVSSVSVAWTNFTEMIAERTAQREAREWEEWLEQIIRENQHVHQNNASAGSGQPGVDDGAGLPETEPVDPDNMGDGGDTGDTGDSGNS